MKALAERRGDSYAISGEKTMITSAGAAQAFVALVKTGGEGISCIFIEGDRPGICVRPIPSFGWRATQWGMVSFDGVRVPAENLIGTEGAAKRLTGRRTTPWTFLGGWGTRASSDAQMV